MSTNTIAPPDADISPLIDGLWQFIHERFAFQAKQIKKLTGQSTAQCYDIVACGHGYSGWRGMKQVIDAIHCMDRWFDLPGAPRDMSKEKLRAMAIHKALSGQDDDFAYDDEGRPNGREIERVLSNLPSGAPLPDEMSDSEADRYLDGITQQEALREMLFYQSLWLSRQPLYSEQAFNFISDFYERLTDLWDGDEDLAELATTAAFGDNHGFEDYWRHPHDKPALRKLDRQVQNVITGKSTRMDPELRDGYLAAMASKTLPIGEWRRLLRNAHPRTLDGRLDQGPIAILALSNATEDCWATLDLSPDIKPKDPQWPANCFAVWTLYAPTWDSAVRCAATSVAIPRFGKFDEDQAKKYNLPHLSGFYEIGFW